MIVRLSTFVIAVFFAFVLNVSAQSAGETSRQAKKTPNEKAPSCSTNVLNPDEDSMSGILKWQVVIKDDNGDVELPKRFRTWWYVRIDGVNTEKVTQINIRGDGFSGGTVVLPVYSYDKVNWHRLKPENIVKAEGSNALHRYTIAKRFDSSNTVWLARYYPYSYRRLNEFINSVKKNKYVKVEKIGTSKLGRDINMLTITDPETDDKNKRRVWIHSRTHPSETGTSFVVEGLVKFLISECNLCCGAADLKKLIFNIVPMVNPDGVALGNGRVTPDSSYDLERMWFREKDDFALRDTCPPEVKALHSTIVKLSRKGPPFIIALNLHSKNAPPEWGPFIYTNFSNGDKFEAEGDSLFKRHLQLAKSISEFYCGDSIDVRPSVDSRKEMKEKKFPEVWWWLNYKDKVTAATLETTSGYNGCFEEWTIYKDHMNLGEAVAKSCQRFYDYFVAKKWHRYQRPTDDMKELIRYFKGHYKFPKE